LQFKVATSLKLSKQCSILNSSQGKPKAASAFATSSSWRLKDAAAFLWLFHNGGMKIAWKSAPEQALVLVVVSFGGFLHSSHTRGGGSGILD
jgi:hypothetical protein